MFYYIVIPILLLQFYALVKVYKIRRNDSVLYRFCDLRRSIMRVLREEELSSSDYIEVRNLLEAINDAISNFNHYKVHIFSIKNISVLSNIAKSDIRESEAKRASIDNNKIKEFYTEFGYALFRAIMAYTPFMKTRIGFAIVKAIIKISIKLGINSANKTLKDITWLNKKSAMYSHEGIGVV